MKQLLRFVRRHIALELLLSAAIVAGGLQASHHSTGAHWVLALAAAALAFGPLYAALQQFQHGEYQANVVAFAAVGVAIWQRQYWVALAVVAAIFITERLLRHALRRATVDTLGASPTQARVLRGGKTNEINAASVTVGDKLILVSGDIVPVDGIVLSGEATCNEARVSGQSEPVVKSIDSIVLSGSHIESGELTVRALHTAEHSQLQQLRSILTTAQHSQSPLGRTAGLYSIIFAALAVVIGVAVWLATGDSRRLLDILVVTSSVPFAWSFPIAMASAIRRGASYGIVARSATALEQMGLMQTTAFNKGGTLTSGEPVVSNITSFSGFTQAEVLELAVSLEQASEHPLAQAIVAAATGRKISAPKAKHVSRAPGQGLQASVKGKHIIIGRLDYLRDEGVSLPTAFKVSSITSTATFVGVDGVLAGVIQFDDPARPEAKQAIGQLKELGVDDSLLLTGDSAAAAKRLSSSLKTTRFASSALPAQKIAVLEQVENRPLGFVGNGANDSAAMTTADIGIALGAGGRIADCSAAKLLLQADNLLLVSAAVRLARRAGSIAKQTLTIGVLLDIIAMAGFATGHIPAIYGVLVPLALSLIVARGALRARLIRPL